ncbi:hypothetical protein HPB47_021431 [Ixodes persulcatus]|uniref:Uncharacterized protein n=1 Tax=Ixodes persulcatus TaxID=34615 RepID=A0AC60QDH0_IXOPE|nr:hypothetical protein HPB47_021431 [Ixodes persulcatus]
MNPLTADEFARLYILPNGWATDLAVVPVVANGTIEDLFGCSTRQLRKGWAFSEERYILWVMVNVSVAYADCILIRSICLPSMKSGLYKQLVALNQNSVVVKAHCDCVAGYVVQPEPPRFQCPILDDEDLHSKKCRQLFRAKMEAIRPVELAEASAICSATVGQGRSPSWKRERVGQITASNFRRVVHCQQPESLVRDILYPQNVILKPGDPRLYDIENEGKAVQQYLELMTYYDKEVRV